MKNLNLVKYITVFTLALFLAFSFTIALQQGLASPIEEDPELFFSQEELDQMLAPIALYPDALLAQILTVATYPLEVVSAARFVKENEGLKGVELLEAAQDKEWDPSVKAMLEFPGVLAMMDEQLDWTIDLGDAFLAQQSDIMDSIQQLREKAYAQGNLVTTNEQVINVEPQTQIIIIETASPQIVYVPVYDPVVVYGTWWYPAYPPYRYYPARYWGPVFTRVVYVDLFWGGWGIWGCDWHHHYVRVRAKRHNDFTRHHYKRKHHYKIHNYDRKDRVWRHNPWHRRNAGYRDSSTARRFGGKKRPGVRRKSSKPDIRRQEERSTKQLKDNVKAKTKVRTRTRPLAIGVGKHTSTNTKQKRSVIKKTKSVKARAHDARIGIKDKKSAKSPKQELNTSTRKQIKVKQPKRNVGARVKDQAEIRPFAINVDKRKSTSTKQKRSLIKKTKNKKPIFSGVGTAIKGRAINWSRARNSRISIGARSGGRSRGKTKINAGRFR